jgi:beta propeller repeat protein
MYDLTAKKETQITSHPTDQIDPSISENFIIWQDARFGDPDIFLYNLQNGKTAIVNGQRNAQQFPDIYGNRIVWSDDRNGNLDVYMTELSINHAPVLAAIGNKTVQPGRLLTFTVSATDADNDTLTYSATTLPPGATFNALTRTFSWTAPSSTSTGGLLIEPVKEVTFTVKDSKGDSDSEDISITVMVQKSTCFLGGTPILMANHKQKPIEAVKVGDKVLAFDEKTKKLKKDRVKEVFHHVADEYLVVNGYLKVTKDHPVYSNGKWIEIGKLKIGDNLFNQNGKAELIKSIEIIKEKADVYNIEVNPYHTYIAGGIVVHNKTAPQQPKPVAIAPGDI